MPSKNIKNKTDRNESLLQYCKSYHPSLDSKRTWDFFTIILTSIWREKILVILQSRINIGNNHAFDELTFPFNASSKYFKKIPGKHPGVLVYGLATKLKKSGMPYLIWYKIANELPLPSPVDMYRECLDWVKTLPSDYHITVDAFHGLTIIEEIQMKSFLLLHLLVIDGSSFRKSLWKWTKEKSTQKSLQKTIQYQYLCDFNLLVLC